MDANCSDIAIVGGGIVGLASAYALRKQFPRCSLRIFEKEAAVGRHQTGHNSGVIHAGIYYKPGSFKARLCVRGVRLIKDFCDVNGIRYENCGKVIVASDESELPRLAELLARGIANQVPGLEQIGPERLREIEPEARAVQALLSPGTAIVNYLEVTQTLARLLQQDGVDLRTGSPVRGVSQRADRLVVHSGSGDFETRHLINCAGLYSDEVARSMGLRPEVQIIPFRGEYYTLRADQKLVRGLIYPVPDPDFPFLGVHFTKRISGEFEAGPNAVLAFAREGYRFSQVRPREMARLMSYPGFWAMARRYWRTGADEFARSLSRRAFAQALQKLVPAIQESDLAPGGAGVRAQAVSRDGSLVDDFRIETSPRAIHVVNAPSPAATASLAIGEVIAEMAGKQFELAA